MGDFKKRGLVKITNGKYEDHEGKEKTRYVIVGEYFASEGGNRKAIKLNATAFSEERWLNIYEDDEQQPKQDTVTEVAEGEPINLDDIPF